MFVRQGDWGGDGVFPNIELDAFVIMPNHVHGIVILRRGEYKDRPYGTQNQSLGRIIQTFKSITTLDYIHGVKNHGWFPFPGKLWQRDYYEHIGMALSHSSRTKKCQD